MSQAPFVQPKARVQALHRQLLEGLQHVDLYDCIYRILSSGIKNTDQMNIMEETDTMDETIRSETEQCGSTSVQLVQLPTHSNISDVSMVRKTGAVEQTRESERFSSTSIQLVQLPTHSNIPGVSMVINTGDSEDQYRPMTPGEEEIMRIYQDGIYRTPDLVERTGGLWIT